MNRSFRWIDACLCSHLPSLALIAALLAGWTVCVPSACADEPAPAAAEQAPKATAEQDAKEAAEEAEEKNTAIEVPDGTAEELFAFAVETMRTRGRDVDSVKRAARGVIDAMAKIRTLDDVTVETEVRAIGLQLPALQFLARMDQEAATELEELMQSLSEDERPAIQNFAKMDQLMEKTRSISSLNAAQRQELADEIIQMADQSGVNPQLYSLASQLAGVLSQVGETEMAVSLYNDFAERMEASEDEQIKNMAERARGSARRIGLLGNTMELNGKTAQGDAFDWSEYRGRVVLVDFWASWCGPCRAEIPNMKRNLEAYGEDFAIVGINMDQTTQAMQAYIDKEELDWVNIVGDEENGTGWEHPIARYYGVTGIPTAILVDQDGKVVSLSARGIRLDAELAKLLGPPPTKEDAVDAEPAAAESE